MQGSNENKERIIKTDLDLKNGQDKCPKCGATDIDLNVNTGKLRCNFCRHEFDPEKINNLETDITKLSGTVLTSGAQDISSNVNDIITLKCSSCGAEVVIDTSSSSQARCHWCRNFLSINEQIPNGSIPDSLLPFKISKEMAKKEIENFVGKRKFFAHPLFKKEFTTENIMGVYFPYMLVDLNSHAKLSGQGEHLVRKYYKGNDNNRRTYYDADLYNVEREFDLVIKGLTIESSQDKLSKVSNKTNNVINAIMPFDTENCVKFNANYLKGYTSEKRDTNVETLRPLVNNQSKDIAKFAVNDTLKKYDRGVCWTKEDLQIKGEQWQTAYLPVWLYSYREIKGNNSILHYVAVNARTKETMGSIPIHMPKLLGVSFIVEIIGFIIMLYIDFDYNWIFLFSGFVYFMLMYFRYRNADARHTYETDTITDVQNLRKVDNFVTQKKGITNSRISGANNNTVNGNGFISEAINMVADNNELVKVIKDTMDK